MCKYAMLKFYEESRYGMVSDSTAAQTTDKLEHIFDTMSREFGVKMEDRQISGLNGEILQRWMNLMKRDHKETSINNYVVLLNPFLRWAHTMTSGDDNIPYIKHDLSGVLHTLRLPDPEKIPEEERPKTKYYTKEEIAELMKCKGSHNKVRDRAAIALLLSSGLRVSELCSLTIGSIIDHPRGSVYVKRKGGAWKETEVGEFAYPYLEAYLKTRKDIEDHDRPLFVTQDGLPCNRVQMYKSMRHLQDKEDVATGVHAFRHTFVSEVEKIGGGAVARDLANHKSVTITNRYEHTTRDQRKTAVNALDWIG